MTITNSILGIKLKFFAHLLRNMSATYRKKFKKNFGQEVFFFIFPIRKTVKIIKNSKLNIFKFCHFVNVL
jgi:hypothetical protein